MDSSKHIHPSTSELADFVGGKARLWCFSPSHDMLAVELTTGARVAYLVLTGCSHISLPVVWSPMAGELRFDAGNSIAPVTFIDKDVRVACEGATLQATDPTYRNRP
jgi:hypothetical protein